MGNEAEIDLLTDRARVAETRGVLILGVGNTLLADEGIGVHVVSELAGELADRDDLTFLDGGTLSFTLAAPIADSAGLIVVDTAQLHAEPGTVRLFEGPEMDTFLATGPKTSVHEVSLGEVLAMTLAQDALPARRVLIGIQPASLDWGTEPTPEVAAAIPEAKALVHRFLKEWT